MNQLINGFLEMSIIPWLLTFVTMITRNVNCSMASYICNHLLLEMSKFVPQLQITFVIIIVCHVSFFVLTPFS